MKFLLNHVQIDQFLVYRGRVDRPDTYRESGGSRVEQKKIKGFDGKTEKWVQIEKNPRASSEVLHNIKNVTLKAKTPFIKDIKVQKDGMIMVEFDSNGSQEYLIGTDNTLYYQKNGEFYRERLLTVNTARGLDFNIGLLPKKQKKTYEDWADKASADYLNSGVDHDLSESDDAPTETSHLSKSGIKSLQKKYTTWIKSFPTTSPFYEENKVLFTKFLSDSIDGIRGPNTRAVEKIMAGLMHTNTESQKFDSNSNNPLLDLNNPGSDPLGNGERLELVKQETDMSSETSKSISESTKGNRELLKSNLNEHVSNLFDDVLKTIRQGGLKNRLGLMFLNKRKLKNDIQTISNAFMDQLNPMPTSSLDFALQASKFIKGLTTLDVKSFGLKSKILKKFLPQVVTDLNDPAKVRHFFAKNLGIIVLSPDNDASENDFWKNFMNHKSFTLSRKNPKLWVGGEKLEDKNNNVIRFSCQVQLGEKTYSDLTVYLPASLMPPNCKVNTDTILGFGKNSHEFKFSDMWQDISMSAERDFEGYKPAIKKFESNMQASLSEYF